MSSAAVRPPRPEATQLAPLSPRERRFFALADFVARHLGPLSRAWNATVMAGLTALAARRRLRVDGLEHLARYGPRDSLLLVANHRSFFDFFLIMSVLRARTRLSLRCFFPVRSTFFYDHPLGPVVNLLMSGMAMFPPIMRHRAGVRFNDYALKRCAAELRIPGTLVGIHPEGTRNREPDPYRLLKVTRGVGRVALEAGPVPVVPVFVLGCGNDLLEEIGHNLLRPRRRPLWVIIGAPVELADLAARAGDPAAWKEAAERCAEAIEAQGARQRELAAQLEKSP